MNILHKLVTILDVMVAERTNIHNVAVESIVGNDDSEYFLRLARFEQDKH